MGTEQPPIRRMNEAEIYLALWAAPDSIKEQLRDVLNNLEEGPEVQNSIDFIEGMEECED